MNTQTIVYALDKLNQELENFKNTVRRELGIKPYHPDLNNRAGICEKCMEFGVNFKPCDNCGGYVSYELYYTLKMAKAGHKIYIEKWNAEFPSMAIPIED